MFLRLDYHNAMLSGIPDPLIYRLLLLLNTYARLLTHRMIYDHISKYANETKWATSKGEYEL